ncbi:hypothetical protein [Bradyrhizobium sp.]|nr:hypothetical protein [Bradyrhizobium sp.]
MFQILVNVASWAVFIGLAMLALALISAGIGSLIGNVFASIKRNQRAAP